MYHIYRICPYTNACPNRRARPCSKNTSCQMPDKASNDHPKALTFRAVGLFGCCTFPCKQRSTRFLFTVYVHIVRTGRQASLFEINRHAPKPLHQCTALLHVLLGHIRYIQNLENLYEVWDCHWNKFCIATAHACIVSIQLMYMYLFCVNSLYSVQLTLLHNSIMCNLKQICNCF